MLSFSTLEGRREEDSNLPVFMQKLANRQSLETINQKSLRVTRFQESRFINHPSSFNLMSNSKKSQIRDKLRKRSISRVGTEKPLHELDLPHKNVQAKTFYALMTQGGYIHEASDVAKKPEKKAWHVQNLKSELDSDFSDD